MFNNVDTVTQPSSDRDRSDHLPIPAVIQIQAVSGQNVKIEDGHLKVASADNFDPMSN